MKILVVGGGGREHAIIQKLKENKSVEKIFALPGNGGIAADAECVNIGAKDIPAIVEFAKGNAIDFAVVAPDDPLVLGCVDALEQIGIPCFGPRANAAIIEGSKVFSKGLMHKYGIPTAASEAFDDPDKAIAYLAKQEYPAVIKADGLALGKGVVIAQNFEEAKAAVKEMMCDKVFGESGSRILVEEFMTGPEVSVLAFMDGKTVVPMVSAMDHKRAKDNDEGLNTGGMGTVAPNPYYTEAVAKECMEKIFVPTMNAPKGPRVIEYNCRFGDPETQVVLPLLESDLLTVMQAVADERLAEVEVKFSAGAACCVVLASDGYPKKYASGFEMTLPETADGEYLFVAGAKREGDKLLTAGGRVIGAVATAADLPAAVAHAYEVAAKVKFENAYCRKDIGKRALAALK